MRKLLTLIPALLCAVLLLGCGNLIGLAEEVLNFYMPATEPTMQTSEETTIPETPRPETPEATFLPTEAEHSPLYIEGVDVEDVILYFNEVVLDAEFVEGGDPSRLQRWEEPIFYTIYGEPTKEDLQTLYDFTVWLNNIESFPGIYETQHPMDANLTIHFCTQDELLDIMGSNYTGVDGAVTFWYQNDEIYSATICYRTDLDQYLRNSVILEEIYNGLGPVQDTALRPDSIIYSEFSQPQSLTEMDELILKLLYHPQLQCGMNAEECEAVIRQLYY